MISRRITITIGSGITILAVLVAILSHMGMAANANTESIKSSVNPHSKERAIDTIFGNDTKVYNAADASSLAGYRIKFPARLPDNYILQQAVMHPNLPQHRYIYLFYSKSPYQNAMPIERGYLNGGGIQIRYDYNPYWMSDPIYGNWTGYINGEKINGYPDAHSILINGYPGWAASNHMYNSEGWSGQEPSVVEYDAKGVEVRLMGEIPLDELTAVAQSMQY